MQKYAIIPETPNVLGILSIFMVAFASTVRPFDMLVTLTGEEYARLLAWHVLDNHLIINTLRYRDSNLYNRILRGVDLYYWEDCIAITQDDPYLVTMDEAKADAELIVKENGIKQTPGYLCISI